MAFSARDLSVLAYANGFTLWHYRTGDSLERLLGHWDAAEPEDAANDNKTAGDNKTDDRAPGYFAPAAEMLRAGDEIKVNLIVAKGYDLIPLVVADISPNGAVRVQRVGSSVEATARIFSAA
jgi:hypothetical protein